MVQFLSSLEQNGKITLAVLEQEMSKLLDDIIVFNPPGKWPPGGLCILCSHWTSAVCKALWHQEDGQDTVIPFSREAVIRGMTGP